MSDRNVQSDHDKDETIENTVQPLQPQLPFQSPWMSHWKTSRYKPLNDDAHSQSSVRSGSGENSHRQQSKHQNLLTSETGKETGTNSQFVKEFREMQQSLNVNDSSSLRNLRHETSSSKGGQHFPMFKSFQRRHEILSLKNAESSSNQEELLRTEIGPDAGCHASNSQTEKCLPSIAESSPPQEKSRFEPKGIISNPNQHIRSSHSLDERRIVASSPPKDELLVSTSWIVPLESNSGRTPAESFIPSTLFVHERKIDNHATLWIDDPSTSNNQLRDFLSERIPRMPSHSDFKLFPSQIRNPEAGLYRGPFELPRIPSSVNDVETRRICTTNGSVQEFTICPPQFPQTTHHFLITKTTDANSSDGGQMFRESSVSTKFKGKQPSRLFNLSPDFGFTVKQGVKLQPLYSSTDSEAEENIGNIRTSAVDLKNESSSDTNTMDIDTLRLNHLSGAASSISNKAINEAWKPSTSEAPIAFNKKASRGSLPNIELPDINLEVSANQCVATSADDVEPSTSRTQSLDAEHFLPNAERPTNSRSSPCTDASSGLDPYSRWVKRLKLSASDSFVHGTKSSKMEGASSHEKVNKLFYKILNRSKNSLEPQMSKSRGKQLMVTDQNAYLLRNAESCSTNSARKNQDVTLSHVWIQRWCHNQTSSSKKKPEASVTHESLSSKANQEKLGKRQFPSIAAMALMGNAMNGFRPCEFQKRGSFIVWNTKELNNPG